MRFAIIHQALRWRFSARLRRRCLPEREASDANFRLLLLAAQTVKRTGKPELPLAYFALWTVKLGGWLPALTAVRSAAKLLAEERACIFLAGRFGDRVRQCTKPGMRALSARSVLELARRMFARAGST